MHRKEGFMTKSAGIHHITGIAGSPRRHVEFYTRVLGLRMVKRTVNFDDPATYHLYFGGERGQPGTILTFFPWPGGPRGWPGRLTRPGRAATRGDRGASARGTPAAELTPLAAAPPGQASCPGHPTRRRRTR